MGLARSTYYDEPEGMAIEEARLIRRHVTKSCGLLGAEHCPCDLLKKTTRFSTSQVCGDTSLNDVSNPLSGVKRTFRRAYGA